MKNSFADRKVKAGHQPVLERSCLEYQGRHDLIQKRYHVPDLAGRSLTPDTGPITQCRITSCPAVFCTDSREEYATLDALKFVTS